MPSSPSTTVPLWALPALAAGLIAWAILPTNPYAFYQVMRWVAAVMFAALAVRAHASGATTSMWLWIALAGIYNPIAPLRMGREAWTLVNMLTLATIAVATGIEIRHRRGVA